MSELRIETASGAQSVTRLEARPVTLGRAPENGLAFPDDLLLSRRHLVVQADSAGWYVVDLGSKNGTTINGERLAAPHRLQHGDRIVAGGVTALFADDVPAPEPEHTVVFTPHLGIEAASLTRVHLSLNQALGSEGKLAQALQREAPGRMPRVEALLAAGRELAGHMQLSELYQRVLDLAADALGARRGVLMTLDNGALAMRAARGEGFRISSSVRDRVMERRESLLIADAQADSGLRDSRTIVEMGVRSLIAVPVQTDRQVIGLLYLDSAHFLFPFTEDDLALATVLANIAAIRIENARLTELELADRMIQHELKQAIEIQRGLLPKAAPEVPGYDIAGMSVPCRFVSGDYFDYLHCGPNRLSVLVGDVSGKGLSAALLLAGVQARAQMLAETCARVDEFVTRLNRGLAEVLPGNRFVTLCAVHLDAASGRFAYSNAGHNPPILLRANGDAEDLTVGGPVLGLLKNAPFAAAAGQLEPGDALLLFSDGASEAESPDEEQFGEERLEDLFVALRREPAARIVERLHEAVTAHMAGRAASDDVTLVVLKRV